MPYSDTDPGKTAGAAVGAKDRPAPEPSNFIQAAIEKDIAAGVYGDRPICTRFPPEPNGYLHIGHAKSVCLNFGTAEKYGGRCNLRFDDTNPVKEDTEYVDSIEEDVRWLGFEWGESLFASDYFEKMYACAVELIKKGRAFVDDLSADEIREYRGTLTVPGRESPWRGRGVEENLRLFQEMRDGLYADGEKVLRAKIDMASPNINMRDPVIYRIAHAEHHNTGDRWRVYPMYDYAHPIEDAIEGVTHSICTLEFEDHRPLYDWVLAELEWPLPPRQIEFARLSLSNTVMSKRHLKALVDSGDVEGWDDPRMPTIAGIRRRGYTPEAIRDFCERIGVSKSNSTVDIALLEHCVREDLKPRVASRNVVEDPIRVVITNYPAGASEELEIENNKDDPSMGSRTVPFSGELYIDGADFMEFPEKKYFRLFPGNEVRLKGAYLLRCDEAVKGADGGILELRCSYDPATKSGSGETRKVRGTIHWVEARTAVSIRIRAYGLLMSEGEDGESALNPLSLSERRAWAEPLAADAKPGERFQFFRHGYYIADAKLCSAEAGGEKVFNEIVGLKSSWRQGAR
ncbi:MAG: glutamine--tRNA ligase/YqeY domain fusion protein [Clostridiales Family XIII bacterium]|jgi:glutaminyl-tRNA synthetase|nr:glutamine--tRNA ligase/YqeY domain fusion protein [Clostridiales Family XIII bacterium]